MKKFIQIASLLSMLVVFTVVSANAQTYGNEVEIPFAFSVGSDSYEAGHYIIKVNKLTNGAATLTIEDTKNDKIRVLLMNVNGDTPSKEVKLVFDNVNGHRYLKGVNTPSYSFAIINSRPEGAEGASTGAIF